MTETAGDIEAARVEYVRQTEQLMGPIYQGVYTESFLKAARR